MNIHPSAVIHPQAEIAADVRIGPYATIEEDVRINAGCEIGAYASIKRGTVLGERNRIFDYAVLGSEPQHTKFRGVKDHSYSRERTNLYIGDDNMIREGAKIERAFGEGEATQIGSRNYIFVNTHIAHNCRVGDDNTIVNGATFGGYVHIEDHVYISAYATAQQYVRIGRYSMIAHLSKITQDVLPFFTVDGNPARVRGLNIIGLRRGGFLSEDRRALRQAYDILFRRSVELAARLTELEGLGNEHVNHLAQFVRGSQRGFTYTARQSRNSSDENLSVR